MLDNKKIFSAISCAILFFVTLIIYMLPCRSIWHIYMCWISMGFVLLAELVLALALITVNKQTFRVGAVVAAIINLIVVSITAIIFVNSFSFLIMPYLVTNIILFAILCVFLLGIYLFSNRIKETRASEDYHSYNIKRSEMEMYRLVNSEIAKDYKQELTRLYEDLKYSDTSSSSGSEEQIFNLISELSDSFENKTEVEKIDAIIVKIKEAVSQRNYIIKTNRPRSI